jgi:hypothetical protein
MVEPIISSKSQIGCAGKGCLTAFFSVFLLAGLIGAGFLGWHFVRDVDTYGWRATPCTITQSHVQERDSDEDPYALTIAFRYTHNGAEHTATTWSTSELTSGDYATVARAADRYAPGSRHTCYVNPADPARAILEHPSLVSILFVAVPLLFAVIGGGGVWMTLRAGTRNDIARGPVGERAIAPTPRGGMEVWVVTGFFGIFLVAGTVGLGVMFVRPMIRLAMARQWESVPCTVVSSRVRQYEHTDSEGHRSTSYRADILYRYEFFGREYRSNQLDLSGSFSSSGYESKRKRVDAHPPGHHTTCWVNPADPYDAVLDRDFQFSMLIGLIPGLFMLVGAGGIIAFRRSRRHKWQRLAQAAAAGRLAERFTGVEAQLASLDFLPPFSLGEGPYRLEPQASRLGRLALVTFAALFWNGITWFFIGMAWMESVPRWVLIPMGLFAIVGLGLIAGVIYQLLAMLNPSAVLTVSAMALRPGDELKLTWQMRGRVGRIRRLRLTLDAIESATYSTGHDSSRTDTETIATLDLVDTTSPSQMRTGQAAVTIPRDAMHSFKGVSNKIDWHLRLRGEIARWPDLDETFTLVVLPTIARRA